MIRKLTLLSLAIPQLTHPQVNLKTGGLEIERDDTPIRRFYNSRTLRRGALGLGWWLDFETHLEFQTHDILWHHGAKIIAFPRPDANPTSANPTVGAWQIACVKQVCRVTSQRKGDPRFYAFDQTGSLLEWRDALGRMFLIRKRDTHARPTVIHTPEGPSLLLEWGPVGSPLLRLGSARFFFDREEELLLTIATPQRSIRHRYSALSNLLAIDGEPSLKVEVDDHTDQVRSLKTANGCLIHYLYLPPRPLDSTRLELRTTRTRRCPARSVMTTEHLFELRQESAEVWRPIRSVVIWGAKKWEVSHESQSEADHP